MIEALLGGALLGAGLMGMLFLTGRSEGVSGVITGLATGERGARIFRACFLGGMLLAGALSAARSPDAFLGDGGRPLAVSALGGLLVGVGARLANGCTSGHGVLGAVRSSPRSRLRRLTTEALSASEVARFTNGSRDDPRHPARTGTPAAQCAERAANSTTWRPTRCS